MESVNLDMEDIFEEEAADDDFPSVGPLPDLPDGEEGAAEGEDEGTYIHFLSYIVIVNSKLIGPKVLR